MNQYKYQITYLPKEEVWHYLGRTDQKVDAALDRLTEEIIEETLTLIKPVVVFEEGELNRRDDLSFLGLKLPGEDINRHLKDSDQAILFAATLGYEIERAIKRYEYTDLNRALIMDACASVAVEVLCDLFSRDKRLEKNNEGLYTTERFSPGYGDLSLSLQPRILERLRAPQMIGLTSSEQNLLRPRKSVTAIIGITKERGETANRCSLCLLRAECNLNLCQ